MLRWYSTHDTGFWLAESESSATSRGNIPAFTILNIFNEANISNPTILPPPRPHSSVEGEVEQEPDGGVDEVSVLREQQRAELLHDAAGDHGLLVLGVEGELLQEGDDEDEELVIVPGQELDQEPRHAAPLHLLLHLDILGQVEQEVDGDPQRLLLLGHEAAELGGEGGHGLGVRGVRSLVAPREVSCPLRVAADLVLEDVEHLGADLVLQDDRVELGEGGEAEEDVDDVGGELEAGAPLLAQHAGQRPHQRLVHAELLQVVRVAGELQQEAGAPHLAGHLLVQQLDVVLQLVDVGHLLLPLAPRPLPRHLYGRVPLHRGRLGPQTVPGLGVGGAGRAGGGGGGGGGLLLPVLEIEQKLLHLRQLAGVDQLALGDHLRR